MLFYLLNIYKNYFIFDIIKVLYIYTYFSLLIFCLFNSYFELQYKISLTKHQIYRNFQTYGNAEKFMLVSRHVVAFDIYLSHSNAHKPQ